MGIYNEIKVPFFIKIPDEEGNAPDKIEEDLCYWFYKYRTSTICKEKDPELYLDPVQYEMLGLTFVIDCSGWGKFSWNFIRQKQKEFFDRYEEK